LWDFIECEKQEIMSNKEQLSPENVQHLNDISTYFEQTIKLLGQAINPVVYQRRFGVLNAIFSDKKKAKDLLAHKKEMMDEDKDHLFKI